MKNRRHFRIFALAALAVMIAPLLLCAFIHGGFSLTNPANFLALGATVNFLDLVKANSNEIVGELVEENVISAPELQFFDAEDLEQPGQLNYETLHRTGFPTVSFAAAGVAFTPSKSTIDLKAHECFRVGGRIEAARHIADNWRRGGAAGYQAFEASGVMKQAFIYIGRQIWDGRSFDGQGFPGIKAFTPLGGLYTYNATGTTSNTASSVYFVKYGLPNCRLIAGRARQATGLWDLPDFRIGDMKDASSNNMEAYIAELSSYIGLQIAQEFSVARIANLTEDSGKTLTDAKLQNALQLLPAGFVPDRIFMSRRSCTQLQNSRTVTLFGTGETRPNQENIAQRPTSFNGIPITETDSIQITDAIES